MLQSAKPVAHEPLHAPAVHELTAMCAVEQGMPHAPQWSGSEPASSVSQPSVSLSPLQSPQPGAQAPSHTPAVQPRMPMWLDEQRMRQPPQFIGSLRTETSQPSPRRSALQSLHPATQVPVHMPPLQAAPLTFMPEQRCRQPPQLPTSVSGLTSQPSLALSPLQSRKPGRHGLTHTPPWHCRATTLLPEQEFPQPPQALGSLSGSVSQPSACLRPLQSRKPASHCPTHTPAVHRGAATWLLEHTRAQPPQLFTSELETSTSQPSLRLSRLQSA